MAIATSDRYVEGFGGSRLQQFSAQYVITYTVDSVLYRVATRTVLEQYSRK